MRHARLILVAILATAPEAMGQNPGITVSRQVEIGCEACGGAAQFGRIGEVSVSSSGEILVVDGDAPLLRRFSVAGREVWAGGRKGNGPGEFELPIRAVLTPGGMTVVDMVASRVTELTPTGAVKSSLAVTRRPMGAVVGDRGQLLIGSDDFRGTSTILQKAPDGRLVELVKVTQSTPDFALAASADGAIAFVRDTRKYEILRFDVAGRELPPMTRAIEPVRRTAEEEAERRARLGRATAMATAEARAAGVRAQPPVFRPDELTFKDPLTIDGLRFDGAGRLWVRTQRGDHQRTVFDLFTPQGAFSGSVTLPVRVRTFDIKGSWLVTASENADGIPVVTLWSMK